MTLTITKREKIMLFVVGLIAVLFLAIQFAIVPLSARYNEGIAERGRLQDEVELHKMEAATIPALRIRNEEVYKKYEELISGYPFVTENEELDYMLTSLSNNHDLKPTSLRISPRPARPPTPENGVSLQELTKATVQMNVVGNYQSLLRLLDEVSNTKYIRLTNVAFTENRLLPDTSRVTVTYEVMFLVD